MPNTNMLGMGVIKAATQGWLVSKPGLEKPVSEVERLLAEADAEDRAGDHLKGCSWMGTEHPSASHYRRAADLRRLAYMLGEPERAAARRRAAAERRHADLMDSMSEDRDF